MQEERYFTLLQELKCLSVVDMLSILLKYDFDLPTSVLVWFFQKSIDLVDGIIQLHKIGLDECGQALIRILFETYLNYTHYIELCKNPIGENAAELVLVSMMVSREKNASEVDKIISGLNLKNELKSINEIKEKYNDSEIKKMKKFGFLQKSIEEISKKYDMLEEYQIMYRNFSRNVHVNDYFEYLAKQENPIGTYDFETRNIAAFSFTLQIFMRMTSYMNEIFKLNMEKELQRIEIEVDKLDEE